MAFLFKLSESDKSFRYKKGDRVCGPVDSLATEMVTGTITEGCVNDEGHIIYEVQTDDGCFFAVEENKLSRI